MSEPKRDEPTTKPTTKPPASPESVSTKVNIAFPFSNIRIEQPSADLAALAVLVREMTDVLAELAPSSRTEDLAQRAQELAARLK